MYPRAPTMVENKVVRGYGRTAAPSPIFLIPEARGRAAKRSVRCGKVLPQKFV